MRSKERSAGGMAAHPGAVELAFQGPDPAPAAEPAGAVQLEPGRRRRAHGGPVTGDRLRGRFLSP